MKMSNKKRNADKKPLMYIVQPDYAETTRSSMQEIVIKRKADKPAPPKAEEKPAYHEKQQEEAVAQDVLQEDQKPAAEPVSQQTQEAREPENIKSQEEQRAEPQAVEETVEHEPPKAEKKEEPALETRKPEKEPEAVHSADKAEEKAPPARKVKKPMSKMTIHEKIDFLTKLPHNMPRALCLIEANGRTYRGVIVGRRNDSVLLRTTGNGAPTELAIDDITSLHPLGF
ncbi:spore coat protein CotO [Bacillus subtilis]|uniref:spore coat protein CotO n=1 Tax=Bacillus TaxID=1386 RepID=UPI0009B5235F|nr:MULTISPECIES: spore coat protein CotO [Bacillus]ASU99326.1 spore coat protein [Bacillus subtilis]MDN4184235.1 spore coat protein CotO [Bacillus subtilis]MDV3522666.1 spore coat protein CotO [Bacillus subtilis subsp. subtilis]MEC0457114.1 spore coat protein CotO [Bacillus subtilis]QAT35811.1 spore coat protein [Bacillus subtilis]